VWIRGKITGWGCPGGKHRGSERRSGGPEARLAKNETRFGGSEYEDGGVKMDDHDDLCAEDVLLESSHYSSHYSSHSLSHSSSHSSSHVYLSGMIGSVT
jgi:hypothetical protein